MLLASTLPPHPSPRDPAGPRGGGRLVGTRLLSERLTRVSLGPRGAALPATWLPPRATVVQTVLRLHREWPPECPFTRTTRLGLRLPTPSEGLGGLRACVMSFNTGACSTESQLFTGPSHVSFLTHSHTRTNVPKSGDGVLLEPRLDGRPSRSSGRGP